MLDSICISHPQRIDIISWTALGESKEAPGRLLSWESDELENPTIVSCIAAFENVCSFNSIQIELHKKYSAFFPSKLRFEKSDEGTIWEPLLQEAGYCVGPHKKAHWKFTLTSAKYLKFAFLCDKENQNGKYFTAFGEIQFFISGMTQIKASSELDRLWVKENIIDRRNEYGWSTAPASRLEKEFVQLDLGSLNQICEARILSKDDPDTFFPISFQLLYSEDDISWHLLCEENGFMAEPACWYRWRFPAVNAQYISLVILEGSRTYEGKYLSQIIEIELYAHATLLNKINHSHSMPPPASTLQSGIVRLALDGESREGVALQASDRRLFDASTERKGIVELASDGESRSGVAVQGSDRRIQYASEDFAGIIRLARDEEVRKGYALQSDDSRLKMASEEKTGLVELASDGESRSGVVVQGNDSRLKYANTKEAGIVKLASNRSTNPNEVVQANDDRLRKANIEALGTVQLARHNEALAEKVVQSNDPRLKNASTENKGIVELAQDGEIKGDKVVQSNDTRLQPATEDKFGIVQLAAQGNNQKKAAVQADDPRLSDARIPLKHEHEYAPKEHDLNSHEGTLSLKKEQGRQLKGFQNPPLDFAPIMASNEGDGAALSGKAKRDAIVGLGGAAGVLGVGLGQGSGVVGAARHAAAGNFLSENFYSVIAGGVSEKRSIQASQLAFLAQGLARFDSAIYSYADAPCIACYFHVKENEGVSAGDVVSLWQNNQNRDKGQVQVVRPTAYGDLKVLGVVVEQAAFILNPPAELLPSGESSVKGPFVMQPQPGKVLVAVSGIVKVKTKADDKEKNVSTGDLLVSSSDPGIAQCLDMGRYRPGMVFGRSLESTTGDKTNEAIRVLLGIT